MKSTTRFSKNKKGIECLNCRQPISDNDNFCSNCGQVNDELPLNIKQFISEFFSGFFSFDSRFFKTFGPLLFKPGKVSKDYIEGKRRRYVSPFQLYLHVTIGFFLLQGLFSTIDEFKVSNPSITDNSESEPAQIATAEDGGNTSLNKLEQSVKFKMDSVFNTTDFLTNFKNDSVPKATKDSLYNSFLSSQIDFTKQQIDNSSLNYFSKAKNTASLENYVIDYTKIVFDNNNIDYSTPSGIDISVNKKDLKNLFGEKTGAKLNAFYTYIQEHKNASAGSAFSELNYKKTRWNSFLFKMAQNSHKAKTDSAFLKAYGRNIVSKISMALFFLLPVFTLLMSLLYIRHKWNYTEHLVFVFNVQTVFFLLLIFFNIFNRVLDTHTGTLIFIPLFLFYLFRALRNFYEQHWFKTFIKFILLNIFYFILSTIGLVIVMFVAFIL